MYAKQKKTLCPVGKSLAEASKRNNTRPDKMPFEKIFHHFLAISPCLSYLCWQLGRSHKDAECMVLGRCWTFGDQMHKSSPYFTTLFQLGEKWSEKSFLQKMWKVEESCLFLIIRGFLLESSESHFWCVYKWNDLIPKSNSFIYVLLTSPCYNRPFPPTDHCGKHLPKTVLTLLFLRFSCL